MREMSRAAASCPLRATASRLASPLSISAACARFSLSSASTTASDALFFARLAFGPACLVFGASSVAARLRFFCPLPMSISIAPSATQAAVGRVYNWASLVVTAFLVAVASILALRRVRSAQSEGGGGVRDLQTPEAGESGVREGRALSAAPQAAESLAGLDVRPRRRAVRAGSGDEVSETTRRFRSENPSVVKTE